MSKPEDWLEDEDREEPEPISCPICNDEFESKEEMEKHSQDHSNAEMFDVLNSQLSRRVDMVSDALSRQLDASMSALAGRSKEVESSPSEEEGRQSGTSPPSEEEVLVGEEGGESRTLAHAASQTTEELEKQGWSRDEIVSAMPGMGQFMSGLGNLVGAARGRGGPSPFEEMGRSMFTASAELTKAMFREIGKTIGKSRLSREEETRAEHE